MKSMKSSMLNILKTEVPLLHSTKPGGPAGSYLEDQVLVVVPNEVEAILSDRDGRAVTDGVHDRAAQAFLKAVCGIEQLEALREALDVIRRESLLFVAHVCVGPAIRIQHEVAANAVEDSGGQLSVAEADTKLIDLDVCREPDAVLRFSEGRNGGKLSESLAVGHVQVDA